MAERVDDGGPHQLALILRLLPQRRQRFIALHELLLRREDALDLLRREVGPELARLWQAVLSPRVAGDEVDWLRLHLLRVVEGRGGLREEVRAEWAERERLVGLGEVGVVGGGILAEVVDAWARLVAVGEVFAEVRLLLVHVEDGLELVGYFHIVEAGVVEDEDLGLLEALAPALLLFVEVLEGVGGLGVGVGVAGDHRDDRLDHLLLALLAVVNEALVGRVVDGEVGVDPDLEVAELVDADLVLLDLEVLGVLVDLGVALEALHQHVEVVGEGDVADLAEAHPHVLHVDAGHVALRADLLAGLLPDEARVDHVRLPVAPVERLQVVAVLLLVGPDQPVLVDLLPRPPVPQRPELPELLRRLLLRQVLPVVGVELRRFDRN